ncbi:DUF4157 domain-containing protein [Nostoc sp. JL31]|uniref:eCIS core domain-containing protein n=1 Tax=Nostoc sp. JL31 TaxID=2815395 RepID=UPI0025D2E782|nr:DUF4157 domain-containing protein [Nostoc sp. JL31]
MHKTKSSKTDSSIYSNSLALNSSPQLAHRPFGSEIQKASVAAKTPTDIENEGFAEKQMEATGLSIQAKSGSITSEGQERLTLLQAKMKGLLNSRLEHATRFGHNIANIPLRKQDTPIQAKLTIGQPGDKYEQEADETARQVVQRIHQQSNQQVQRETVTEEEELQTKPVENIQHQELPEDEELQMKPMVQRVADGGMAASADVEAGIQSARGDGQSLAYSIREPMEQAFGADFSGVRVHTDSQADQLNQSIQAKAFTTAQDVFFRQGAYQPGSRGGQELLAHELTHVVQQGGGNGIQPLLDKDANRPIEEAIQQKEVAQPKLLHEARSKPTAAQNLKLAPSAASYFAPVIQREILIGDTRYKPYNEQLLGDIYNLARPYINQWGKMDEIFQRNSKSATRIAKNNYLDQDGESVNGLRNDMRAMLRKYNGIKAFDNNQDLARQVVQDVKLRLLGMENVIGVDHQDGQFSEANDEPTVGRTGKTKTLRIYRTMSAANWNNYTQSNDLGNILYGHGGSLGQAMHYFAMSKRDAKDDVLVEFEFSNKAQNLMNYTQISRGGEGGAPRDNKLTGKSEQNDIMGLDQSIFSVNLHKSKDLIKQLNPQVKLIDRAS